MVSGDFKSFMKYMVISQPKAGTYLCGNLLEQFGLYHTYFHFRLTEYTKYNRNDISGGKKYKGLKHISKPLAKAVEDIPNEGFALGHLAYSQETEETLYNFKKVLLFRNFEDSMESTNRFLNETGRKFDRKSLKPMHENIIGWKNKENTFCLNFEDMISKNTKELDKLQLFLFNEIKFDSLKCMEKALNKDSITKSSLRK